MKMEQDIYTYSDMYIEQKSRFKKQRKEEREREGLGGLR